MGIDLIALEAILLSYKYVINKENLLTLGRQGIHINKDLYKNLFNKYAIDHDYVESSYCETLFSNLGFKTIDSIDANSYENASIIHNMNNPIPTNFKNIKLFLKFQTFIAP